MGKVKIKKKSVWIDMTPMSDVMVLLLTFFMLTATFTKNEAIKVNEPSSVSEIKVPEQNNLTILVDKDGKVFLGMEGQKDQQQLVSAMAGQYNISLNSQQLEKAKITTNVGVPLEQLAKLYSLDQSEINKAQSTQGIPTDSIVNGEEKSASEFQEWVMLARQTFGLEMTISVKADATTPYKTMKKILSEMQDISEDRYNLLTTLKKGEEI